MEFWQNPILEAALQVLNNGTHILVGNVDYPNILVRISNARQD